jgi:beta-1,4-mannosyltransferase
MLSFSRTNRDPFTTLLFDALSSHLVVHHFSWRGALVGRYDVLHMHWHDHLTQRRGPLSTVGRRLAYLVLMIRVRLGHQVLVRTLHNVAPHEARQGVERWLLRLTDRWTDAYITMQADTPLPSVAPSVLIPQGHYRDVYGDVDVTEPTRGVLLFFGNLRSYKGVPALLQAFLATADGELRLRIVGRAFDPGLADAVERARRADSRISSELGWVSHEQLAAEIGRAELVVLPYLEMHNSGTVLVALSLDRPVLIPSDPRTRSLAIEVGPGWVHTYEPPLRHHSIAEALDALRSATRTGRPDLSGREWKEIAAAHVAAYQDALRPGLRRKA